MALASVLVLDPEVLLMDEPTAALDPKSQSMVVDFLVGWSGGAKTVITATHDLDMVAEIADHRLIFQHGKIVAEGPPAQLLGDTALLERTNLSHAHRHRHIDGSLQAHPHRHDTHDHTHPDASG